MSTAKLREIEKVPDQKLALAAMIAKDHAAGRHTVPLPKCGECGETVYTEPVKPVDIDKPAPKPREIGTPEEMARWQKASVAAFGPKRSKKAAVPQFVERPEVIEVPEDTTAVIYHPSGVTPDGKLKAVPVRKVKMADGTAVAIGPKGTVTLPIAPAKGTPVIIDATVGAEEASVVYTPTTREAWLLAAAEEMRPWFAEAGSPAPVVRVSVGWPGGRGSKVGVRGQCWSASTVEDGQPAIFITPDENDPATILAILLHELDHAVGNFGHRGAFAKLAGKLGLTAPWKTVTPSTPLAEKLAALAAKLGPFPHARVNPGHGLAGTGPTRPPVQTTRMLKLQCPTCEYTVRTTAKWIAVGLPSCPDGDELEPAK